MIGRSPHFLVSSTKHHLNLFAAVVGDTSKARKGTAWDAVVEILVRVDASFEQRIHTGLSSGEGLIWKLRDPGGDDEGASDKRLLVLESELASVLRVTKREGSTLSTTIRNAWDRGTLEILTKNSPIRATNSHLSIVGHITREELLRYLDRTEIANGFANRFLWVLARRSKVLPDPGRPEEASIAGLVACIRSAFETAKDITRFQRSGKARELWEAAYIKLSQARPGLFGAITARAEAQVIRLSALYAALDCTAVIEEPHLQAALSLWDYSARCLRCIFSHRIGDPVADEILLALIERPDGMTRKAIRDLFARNRSGSEIERALRILEAAGAATCEMVQTAGRPAERWRATEVSHTT